MLGTSMMLAQLPESEIYIAWWKLLLVAVAFVAWTLYAAWADKDALAVNTYRVTFNLVNLGVGGIGLGVVFLVPIFWAGWGVFLIAFLGSAGYYAAHRNALVRDEDQILTPAHLKRVMQNITSGGGRSGKQREVKELVRVRAADGKWTEPPDDNEAREIYSITQQTLFDMRFNRAQSAEIVPGKEESTLYYWVDGVRTKRETYPREQADRLIVYLKEIAGLDLEERRKPQIGGLRIMMAKEKTEVEVTSSGSMQGEHLRLHIYGDEVRYKIEDIGFTQGQIAQMRQVMTRKPGLIIITGPKDSGLTTTIYSLARTHDAFLQNIQMLEFKSEIEIDNVTQLTPTGGADQSFTGDLQKIFRSDPDIVVIPEVRDQASAVIITEAAAKMPLAYVGLNESDVFRATIAWIKLVGAQQTVADALTAVTNQRLIRMLCDSCKEAYKPDAATLRKLNLPPDTVLHRQPKPELDKRGNPIICPACQGTGYRGRTAIFEVLVVDDGLKRAIGTAKSLGELQQAAGKQPGIGLQKQAMQKVLDGVTSIQEITRVLRAEPAKPAPSAKQPSGGGRAA